MRYVTLIFFSVDNTIAAFRNKIYHKITCMFFIDSANGSSTTQK